MTAHPILVALEAEIRRLASESPSFIYQRRDNPESGVAPKICTYVKDGCGDCIFGQALLNTNTLTSMQLSKYEGDGIRGVLSKILPNSEVEYLGSADDYKVIRWAEAVQKSQDRLASWGEAVSMADALVVAEGW